MTLLYAPGKIWKSGHDAGLHDQSYSVLPFEGLICRESPTISELYAHHSVELICFTRGLQASPAKSRESLQAKVRSDSLQFVILYPTPSDSAARGQFRRDSLRGIAFS